MPQKRAIFLAVKVEKFKKVLWIEGKDVILQKN
jgi:hypothetical protein